VSSIPPSIPWSPPFKSHLVLEERIAESTIRAYYVGFDQKIFRLQALANVIVDVIPEFAMGYYQGAQVSITDVMPRIREAAKRIYTTDKYQRRGEFGELILHLLLRDFCRSVPLISKIYFKDTDNATVHGFDGVHVVTTPSSKQLWLGESKFYDDGPQGIQELLLDLKKHLQTDYLKREFALISTKLPEDCPDIEYWREMFHANKRLDSILDSVCVPMLCTYTSPVYSAHSDNTPECLAAFEDECRALHKQFGDGIGKDPPKVDVVLLLLPVNAKSDLVSELDKRLKAMQSI
jgi:hypothetical protein